MKYINLLLCLIFLLFTGWQYNDPDPLLWVPIYGVSAYCAWQAYKGKANTELLLVLTVLALGAGLNTWSQMTAWEGVITGSIAMKTHNQELAREALGLGICGISFILFIFTGKK